MTGPLKEQNNDTVFQDAIDALRRGDKARAKELLTLLLQTNQNNPAYWIWLSAATDTQKERVYCLQTALKLDPENSTAKRGLILLGALAPDETIQPFPMNRPRAWEEKLLLSHEKPKERGIRAALRNPAMRLTGLVVLGVSLCAALFFGVILPRQLRVTPTLTSTPGPSPTFTATPTIFGATAVPPVIATGPTPLSSFLQSTYTPTPLYVNTPHSAGAIDQFRIAKAAYDKGDWDAFIQNMELVKQIEPDRADVYYYLGEGYRFKGDNGAAASAYNDAIDIDSNFAPAYLGLARVRLASNPKFNAETLLKQAIQHDPNFGEAYLERARFYINRGDLEEAFKDLEFAEKLLPGSPEVYLAYANAYVESEDSDKALEYAQKAYSADIVHMPTYKLLGDLYLQREDYGNAAEALRLYTAYQTNDAVGFAKLGEAYYYLGEYQNALNAINSGTALNPRGLRQYYVYRGLSLLELGSGSDAVSDLEVAVDEDDQSFDARLGLARAYYMDNKFGSAFLQIDVAKSLEETDEQKALELYWRAKIQEKRNEIIDAIKAWQALLKLDESVMAPEMRGEAESRVKELVPPTRTLTPTNTPRGGASTSTPTAATKTPKPNISPTPSRTPTSAPTRTPTP